MVVEECWSLVDLYNGIIEVLSTSSCPFEFPETFKEQPFSTVVASKQLRPFQPCNLAAKLGEVASFGTYLKFMVEWSRDCDTVADRTPMRTIEVLMEAKVRVSVTVRLSSVREYCGIEECVTVLVLLYSRFLSQSCKCWPQKFVRSITK